MKTLQEEEKEALLVTELQHEASHLKDLMAEKHEQIRMEIRKEQKIKVAQYDTIIQLTRAEAELKETNQRRAGLEKLLSHRHVHVLGHTRREDVDVLNKELSKEEEALKLQLLEQEQQMEEQISQRSSVMEKCLTQMLLRVRENYEEELFEVEETLVRWSEEMEGGFNEQLSVLRERWETRAQRHEKELLELQEKVEEEENWREEQEQNQKEMEHLREELQQLQVRSCTCPLLVNESFIRRLKCLDVKIKTHFSFQQLNEKKNKKKKKKVLWRN